MKQRSNKLEEEGVANVGVHKEVSRPINQACTYVRLRLLLRLLVKQGSQGRLGRILTRNDGDLTSWKLVVVKKKKSRIMCNIML